MRHPALPGCLPIGHLPRVPLTPKTSPQCPLLQALALILDVLCGISGKEEDDSVRESLAEAVLCLARVDDARKQLWKAGAPTLLQKGCAGLGACTCIVVGVHNTRTAAVQGDACSLGALVPLQLQQCHGVCLPVAYWRRHWVQLASSQTASPVTARRPRRYELEENPTVCACMEATAELFLADGFEPAPQDGGEGVQEAAAGQQQQQFGSEALPLPRQEPPRVVIEEID